MTTAEKVQSRPAPAADPAAKPTVAEPLIVIGAKRMVCALFGEEIRHSPSA